jgi:hypothetical protein
MRPLVLTLIVATTVISGCAERSPAANTISIPDEAAAIERAREFTVLREPITITNVAQGQAGALVFVPTGFVPNEQEGERELAKRRRPAWAVTLVGMYPIECGDAAECQLQPTQHQIAIDRETGELLLQVLGGDIKP